MSIFKYIFIVFLPIILLQSGCVGRQSSWTYEINQKTTEGTKINDVKSIRVATDWKAINGSDMIKLPLFKGKEWGNDSSVKRADHMYCYYVKDEKNLDLSYIKGVEKGLKKVYTIVYDTLPDHEQVEYAEGVGIISYNFVHHGTVDEKHVRLVEMK